MSKKFLNSPVERFTRLLFSRVIERLAVVVVEENLSFSQMAALHIVELKKDININDMSKRLSLSVSATSRLIDELVKKDFIGRKEDQNNRRSKNLSLTSKGKKLLDKLSLERIRIFEKSGSLQGFSKYILSNVK